MVAAYRGFSEVMQILLYAKADVNTCITAGKVGCISLLYIHWPITHTLMCYLSMKIMLIVH